MSSTFKDQPFSMVHRTMWACLEQHPWYADYMKKGNAIKFDTRSPLRDTLQAGDLPELILTSQGGTYALRNSSNSSGAIRRYDWVLNTGDLRLDELLYPMSWMLFESMVKVKKDLLALEWGTSPDPHKRQFVKKMHMVDLNDGESAAARRTVNVRGWTTVQSIEVDMIFSTNDLVNGATP